VACVLRKCEKCRRLSERRIRHLPCPRGGKQSPRHIVREVRALARAMLPRQVSRTLRSPWDLRVQKAIQEILKKADSVAGLVMSVALAAKKASGGHARQPAHRPASEWRAAPLG
jgi:hypothetical protein